MGIYVHIPFCRNKCFYCGFYSVASMQMKEAYLKALLREIELRQDYLPDRNASTLYFGGGTPSCLSEAEVEMIIDKIRKTWRLTADSECSIEVNPEDASPEKLKAFRRLGFNRITLGVQSFRDDVLKRINRCHDARQAVKAIETAQSSGFDNIGIDLIIGLPGSCMKDLEQELRTVNELDIPHISVYILSLDSNSVFEKLAEKGKFQPLDDDALAEQYLLVSDYLKSAGYEHYEISNFAKDFKYSRHNTSYWQQQPYIGLGAAAHSFDLDSRQWNVAHIKKYINGLNEGSLNFEKETLTDKDRFNEYLMTRLRTMWGIEPAVLTRRYPEWGPAAERRLAEAETRGLARRSGNRLRLTEQGWLLSDAILRDLFI